MQRGGAWLTGGGRGDRIQGLKISRKSEYAVRALVEMALRSQPGMEWQQIAQVAAAAGVPEKFLEQILLALKKRGLLRSRRGVDGGYALARPAGEITLEQIVLSLEGDGETVSERPQEHEAGGLFRGVMAEAEEAARRVLRGKTLEDLSDAARDLREGRVASLEFEI
jgi:Rrf2 family protein